MLYPKITQIFLTLKLLVPLLFLSFIPNSLKAQFSPASNTPDCYLSEILTSVTRTAVFDNRNLRCSVWRVQVVNLSNAASTYSFDTSTNTVNWYSQGGNSVGATSAGVVGEFTTSADYISLIIRNKGTGNVIVALSGYAYTKDRNPPNFEGPCSVCYTVIQDYVSADVQYIGYAKSIFDPNTNTGYNIFHVTRVRYSSGNFQDKMVANGNGEENNAWTNRASLTYK